MAALKLIKTGGPPRFGISSNMAALKLITSSSRPLLCMSASTGSTHCHRPPLTQAEIAALKLITP
eukprot:1217867-Karenia_brevis.AAC.1